MHGLLHVRIPLLARRTVSLIPAIILLTVGVDPTWALVVSQVVLSFQLPFAMWPLIRFTGDRALMGGFANGALVRFTAWGLFGVISVANVWLVGVVLSGFG